MTREDSKKLLPVIEAFANGKTVQVRFGQGWSDTETPSWSDQSEFRLKPEPLECWVTVYNDHLPSTVHTSKEGALKVATTVPGPAPPSGDKGWTVRKFREVIE